MRAVVQRVRQAHVEVDGQRVGAIDRGLLVLLAVMRGDGEAELQRMAAKIAGLRIFPDAAGKMNLDLKAADGAILAVSQFTLAADVRKGFRPSFGAAEEPLRANALYERFCALLEADGITVARGVFAADMQVGLVNDGPVTLWLDFPPPEAA